MRACRGLGADLAAALAVVALATGPIGGLEREALGEGLDSPGLTARAVGRAGASLVSADDEGALYDNPAGLARRGGLRVSLGLALSERNARIESELGFDTPSPDAVPGLPVVKSRAGVAALPSIAAMLGLSQRVVVGAAYLQPTDLSFAYATPPSVHAIPAGEQFSYPTRYAATRFHLQRRGVGAGVAVRALPWLALGVSGFALDVELTSDRTISAAVAADYAQAGAFARGALPNADQDMELSLEGRDRMVPVASAGALVAPADIPLELGVSVQLDAGADLSGPVTLQDGRKLTPAGDASIATATTSVDAAASLSLPKSVVVQAGVRYLAERFTTELDAAFRHLDEPTPAWTVIGDVALERTDLGQAASLRAIPLATAFQPSFELRGAVEVDAFPGFLTLTAGYRFASSAVPRSALSAALPDLDSHTFALGVEARLGTATLTLGIARTEMLAARVLGTRTAEAGAVVQGESRVELVAPLLEGAPLQAAAGRYDGDATVVALGVEVTL